MIASNGETHDNLVDLTGRMTGGVPGVASDDQKGISALASNEGEAMIADTIQTLSFTSWIGDICEGYQKEKELDIGTTEYNANSNMIREDITKINNLGRQMGMKGNVIATPENGKEAIAASKAVYNNFALPYQAGSNVDYAKYMQMQELNNQMSHSMKRLNEKVAQSNTYGTHAKNFWNEMSKASNQHSALSGEFLESVDTTDRYTRKIAESSAFLLKEQQQSAGGVSDINMGGISQGNKIDFEGDDMELHRKMAETINKASQLVKVERGMLKAGHVSKNRRGLFEATLKGYMTKLSTQKKEIERDDVADMRATSGLEKNRTENPEDVTVEDENKYLEMVEKQKKSSPNFSSQDLKDCAQVAKLAVSAMNVSLMAVNVVPMSTAMTAIQFASMGKLAHDIYKFTKKDSQDNKTINQQKYKGMTSGKEKDEVEAAGDNSEDISFRDTLAVKRKALDFANRTRVASREGLIQLDENALDYDATKNLNESIEKQISDIIATNDIADDKSRNNTQSQALLGLNNTMKMGTGYDVFDKDPQEMTNKELDIYTTAVTAIMFPMKDENGKYLPNFYDHFAVGEETMPEPHEEYTTATTDLMIIGKQETALMVSNSQTKLIDLSHEYNEMYGNNDLTKVGDTTQRDIEMREAATKHDDKMRSAMDVYKPLCAKAGLMAGVALYKKHEYNKAWKQSVADRNLQLMCQGTVQQMEKSQREGEMLSHENLYGSHGLLR